MIFIESWTNYNKDNVNHSRVPRIGVPPTVGLVCVGFPNESTAKIILNKHSDDTCITQNIDALVLSIYTASCSSYSDNVLNMRFEHIVARVMSQQVNPF